MEHTTIQMRDIDAPEMEIYAKLNEVQLRRYYEPEPGLFIAESLRVIARALDAGYEPQSLLIEPRHLEAAAQEDLSGGGGGDAYDDGTQERFADRAETALARSVVSRCAGVPIYVAEEAVLSTLAGYKLTGGALCAMHRRALPSIESICGLAGRIVVLESVTNPTNVGAIFRSAAALGAEAVLLTDDCSDPFYRRAARVSMGTVFRLPWTYFPKRRRPSGSAGQREERGRADVSLLREAGYVTIAMALADHSEELSDIKLSEDQRVAVVLGNENDGLSEETISLCDHTAVIPMANGVDSLNVAAASAVAFWELLHR